MLNCLPKIGIYKLTNLINGKIYIGKSINLPKRILNYRYGKHQLIARAIQKYGWENFSVLILESFIELDNETLLNRESFWIKSLRATDRDVGYNLSSFSMDRTGVKCSEETKRKISLANKGKRTGKDNPIFGKHHSEDTLKKMRKPRSLLAKINMSIRGKNRGNKPICQIDVQTGNVIKTWKSVQDACLFLSTSKKYSGLISMVCNKKKNSKGFIFKTAYGYKWEYA